MLTDPKPETVAHALKAWAGERTNAEIARQLLAVWTTVDSWLSGATVPRDRDLIVIAHQTGLPLDQLKTLAAADRARRSVRVDTVDQAKEWVQDHASEPKQAVDA